MPFDFELYHRAILTSHFEVNVVVLRLHSLLRQEKQQQQRVTVGRITHPHTAECGDFRFFHYIYVPVFTYGEPSALEAAARFQQNANKNALCAIVSSFNHNHPLQQSTCFETSLVAADALKEPETQMRTETRYPTNTGVVLKRSTSAAG